MSRSRVSHSFLGQSGRADNSASTSIPLYANDDIIARIVLGEGEAKLWRRIVDQLEREGLPQPRQLFGGLRYVPAVLEFFHRREGFLDCAQDRGFADDGEECFEP